MEDKIQGKRAIAPGENSNQLQVGLITGACIGHIIRLNVGSDSLNGSMNYPKATMASNLRKSNKLNPNNNESELIEEEKQINEPLTEEDEQ